MIFLKIINKDLKMTRVIFLYKKNRFVFL